MGLTFRSIAQYHADLHAGTVTCEEAVQHYLIAIAQQQHLNAYLRVYGEEALDRARMLDYRRREGHPTGKLHGVVIGLKDVIAYKGHPLTAASRILEGYVSIYSATVVDKLLEDLASISDLERDLEIGVRLPERP